MKKPNTQNETTKDSYVSGCKICNTLNDGICMSICLQDAKQRKEFIAQHKAQFTRIA